MLARRHAGLWASLSPIEETACPSSRAQAVVEFIRQYGASFFDELVEGTGLLRPQVEEALGELVALGIVTSDSFGGLRALLRKPATGRRRQRAMMFGMESAGRWAMLRLSGVRGLEEPVAGGTAQCRGHEHLKSASPTLSR